MVGDKPNLRNLVKGFRDRMYVRSGSDLPDADHLSWRPRTSLQGGLRTFAPLRTPIFGSALTLPAAPPCAAPRRLLGVVEARPHPFYSQLGFNLRA